MEKKIKNDPERKIDKMPRAVKVLALVCALLGSFFLWLYAIGYDETLFERPVNGISVEVVGAEELKNTKNFTLAPDQDLPDISITAKGKQRDLSRYKAEDFKAVIDISKIDSAGEHDVEIKVISPNGVSVVQQSSSFCRVFIDKFITKDFSVDVDTGTNFYLGEGVVHLIAYPNPENISVSGPESIIETIEKAVADFRLNGVTVDKTISGQGDINLVDKNGNTVKNRYVTLSSDKAYVTINLEKEKTVPVTVKLIGGVMSADSYVCNVSQPTIKIRGEAHAVDAIDKIEIPVDETALDGDLTAKFSPSGLLPKEVVRSDGGESQIEYTVKIPKLTARTYNFPADKIIFENLPDDKNLKPKDIKITLMGALDAFENNDVISMLSVSVDYNKNISSENGEYSAVAKVKLNGGNGGMYVLNQTYTVIFTEAE